MFENAQLLGKYNDRINTLIFSTTRYSLNYLHYNKEIKKFELYFVYKYNK